MNNQTILNQVADYIENKFYFTVTKSRIVSTGNNFYMCYFDGEGGTRIDTEVYLYNNKKSL